MKKIILKDVQDAIKSLTTGRYTGGCWHQTLATTDDGTELCFVIGWSNAGYDQEEIDQDGYGCSEDGVCLCAKIAYQHSDNGMQSDFDLDWRMPYDVDSNDVWDTSTMVYKDGVDASFIKSFNDDARDIWGAYGENGGLDAMESKKKESNHHHKVLHKKSEGYGNDLRISASDLEITLTDVFDNDSYGRSFGTEISTGEKYTLDEFNQLVKDMCEDSSGYATVSRDGSEILVEIYTPDEDESGDYSCSRTVRGTVRVMSTSIEAVADYLDAAK